VPPYNAQPLLEAKGSVNPAHTQPGSTTPLLSLWPRHHNDAILLLHIVFFWVPFIAFNKYTYNRYFVGPVGQDLFEGLAEFKNPWKFQYGDEWISEYIYKKYNLSYGTPEFDDKAKEEFLAAIFQQPLFFIKTLVWRFPQIILPGLPWIYHRDSPYPDGINFYQKIVYSFQSLSGFFDFIFRHVYIRLFIFLGYLGILYCFWDKKYFPLLILLTVLVSGLGKFPSHIEYRYLIPSYWIFTFFVGFLLWRLSKKLNIMIKKIFYSF